MKKIGLLLLCILVMTPIFLFAEEANKFEAKKFKVTIEVVYNDMTLEEAAKKEKIFKDQFKDACKIDIKLNSELSGYMMIVPNNYIYQDSTLLNDTTGIITTDGKGEVDEKETYDFTAVRYNAVFCGLQDNE